MKTLKIALVLLALILIPSLASAQQYTLTQTTLSSDVTSGGGTGGQSNIISLASVTNIVGQSSGPGTGTAIYIDRELMSVISVNTSAKSVNVLRGINGTLATAHKASTMVLYGNPNAFVNFDQAGSCVVAQVPAQPSINVFTGNQWLCSSVTLTWVPGFGNHDRDTVVSTAVASVAGATLPSGPLFHITGTNAITSWTIPVGCNATVRGGCTFTVIPDAAFTLVAGNNIATSVTAVANLPIIFTWDATNSKFVSLQSK